MTLALVGYVVGVFTFLLGLLSSLHDQPRDDVDWTDCMAMAIAWPLVVVLVLIDNARSG